MVVVETFGRVDSPLVEFSPEAATSSYFVYGKGNLEEAPFNGKLYQTAKVNSESRYTALTVSELAKVKEAFAHLNEVAIYPILGGSIMAVTIKVPATSANIGLGFDSLGIAVNLYLTLQCRRTF